MHYVVESGASDTPRRIPLKMAGDSDQGGPWREERDRQDAGSALSGLLTLIGRAR
jgi:hypothetical protein